jgi:SAM-dependent methyltransferase
MAAEKSQSNYKSFWDWTGHSIPPFYDAPSTHYYFECERQLFVSFFPDLSGKRVFKTDLWDEAKNTRILNWAAQQGAEVFGLDISGQILAEARRSFERTKGKLGGIVSDLREIGFKDESFDLIYSMGTVEHFPEYRQAIEECFRVLRKGGKAIFGVPNTFDPFLRPLLVAFLNGLSLYAYGEEKSFGMKTLERLLREAGFQIIGRGGILFMPGWLRMLDLFLYVRWPGSRFWLAPLVRPFAYLYRKFPLLRRQGYLIACVVQKP